MKPLTLAEYRVAMFLARGLRRKEVASAIGISVSTVAVELGRISAKLGIDTDRFDARIKVAAWYWQHAFQSYDEYARYVRYSALLQAVSKPIKLPNRRRREDRELPARAA